MKPEKLEIGQVIKKAEYFDYGNISQQAKELIEKLSQGKEINKEKYSQISKKTFKFLKEKFSSLPEEEREVVLFHLLTTPSPKEQEEKISSIEYLSEKKEKLKEEKERFIEYLTLILALEKVAKDRNWYFLLHFYQNPENRKIRPDILEEALEGAKESGYLWDLFHFYQNPENQKIRPEIFK
ncbi:MAG: hypothetical protein ACPLZH_01560, partial [Minisyncoccales bacterium]